MKEKDLSVLEENVETENKSEIEIYKGFTDYKKEELEKFRTKELTEIRGRAQQDEGQ